VATVVCLDYVSLFQASSAVFHSMMVAVGAIHRVGCELTKVTKLVYHTITDQYRVGLKPILRKIWAPIGERPSAIVCHRYEWVYLYGFVNPPTGKTEGFIIPRVNCEWLNLVLEKVAL
jgi:hypothetical protein